MNLSDLLAGSLDPNPKGDLELIFCEEPVPLEVFVRDRKFMGSPDLSPVQYEAVRIAERIYYPELYPLMGEYFDPYWAEPLRMVNFVNLQWGKGSGKGHVCRTISLRVAYLLLCLRSPQEYFGMPSQDSIHLLNVAMNAQQAQRAFFDPVEKLVRTSPWFKDKAAPTRGAIVYDKNVEAISGHSEAESQEGLNLLLGVADEIDGFRSKEEVRGNSTGRVPQNTVEGILDMMRTSSSPQPLDSLVLTPDRGFVQMGSLKIGDRLVDPRDNVESYVEAIYPQGVKDVYKLTFSDGTSAESTADHKWEMWRIKSPKTVAERKLKGTELVKEVVTTEQLMQAVQKSSYSSHRYRLPDNSLAYTDLGDFNELVDPYLLGLLLGDGGLTHYTPVFTSSDQELVDLCNSALPPGVRMVFAGSRSEGCNSYRLSHRKGFANPLTSALKDLGVWGHGAATKFVPEQYKLAPAWVRLAVLQGLMDTDGSSASGYATFTSASKQLRDDVAWLARSLGLRAICRDYAQTGKGSLHVWSVSISEQEDVRVFRLSRKLGALVHGKNRAVRSLISVEYSRTVETQCIAVSAPSALYVTDNFVITHNTRFPVTFKNVRISYPRYLGSAIQRLTQQSYDDIAKRGEKSRHFVSGPLPTWVVNPNFAKFEKVAVSGTDELVPEVYVSDYEEDAAMAKAKYECKPSKASNPFFRNEFLVKSAFTPTERQPVEVMYYQKGGSWEVKYDFAPDLKPIKGAQYCMHGDLAVTGDRAGIAMAHVVRKEEFESQVLLDNGEYTSVREMRPIVKLDFVFSFSADKGSSPPREIQIRWARELAFELKKRGFRIKRFTFDGFESRDSMQILEKSGIESKRVSTDRTNEPWRNLMDIMYDGRLIAKERKLLIDELLGLTVLPNGKVDHPRMGSKDEADAAACAIFGAVGQGGRENEAGEEAFYQKAEFFMGPKVELPVGMTHNLLNLNEF